MDKRNWRSRAVGEPRPGYFKTKLVKHGPLVPARIRHENGLWWAEIGTATYEAASDPAAAPRVFPIWHGAEEITAAEYDALMARVRAKAPGDILATPDKPIDLKNRPPLF